ncbi:MAG: DegT/DnrJ/EryC1/StrS family aminotransferase [Methanobacteriota archaeon]|nr:MAG: DegT/DnrJ/EryC1/StrS family aminotransferase [Euryarchaeota archaeon]
MIPIAKPNIGKEEEQAVLEVLRSGYLVRGPKAKELEEKFSGYVGRKFGISTSSGTAALHVALIANGVGKDDEVIIPPLTFFATASSVLFCGAKPVFVDIDPDTFNMEVGKIEEAITPNTKAIMPVHLYGQPVDMKPLMEIAGKHNLKVIEDACQSHGAEYEGKKVGSFGEASCFSFYPTKNMVVGEGGMVLVDDQDMKMECTLLREHGEITTYEHVLLGYNYRMNEIAAAIGVEQLKKLPGFIDKRQENAKRLTEGLADVEGIQTPVIGNNGTHVYYQYIIKVTKEFPLSRDELVRYLTEKEIGARPSYPKPLSEQAILRTMGMAADCPVAREVLFEMMELPVHPLVSNDDITYIIDTVREVSRMR